jgi:hypothetical protein
MILVDSSVWIEHFREPDSILLQLLGERRIFVHPFVIGEVALGHVRRREAVLAELNELRRVVLAEDEEVLQFIHDNRLFGLGIGYIDTHLLVSTKLTKGASIWTLDARLRAAAVRLGLAADAP